LAAIAGHAGRDLARLGGFARAGPIKTNPRLAEGDSQPPGIRENYVAGS